MTRPAKPVRAILADDNALARMALSAMLSHMRGVRVLAEARDGNELLGLLRSIRADVIITDLNMPGLDGLGAIGKIRETDGAVGIVVVSMQDDPEVQQAVLAKGADAFLRKDASFADFETTIHAVTRKNGGTRT